MFLPINIQGCAPLGFIGRTDAKAEAPILWPPDANSQHIGKDHDSGKDYRQKEKEMIRWLIASLTQRT